MKIKIPYDNIVTIDPGDEGLHLFTIVLRQYGTLVDKIVLTTDISYTPTGLGPAENPTEGGEGERRRSRRSGS